jgi:hypothetical protein
MFEAFELQTVEVNEMDFCGGTWWDIFKIKVMKGRFTR